MSLELQLDENGQPLKIREQIKSENELPLSSDEINATLTAAIDTAKTEEVELTEGQKDEIGLLDITDPETIDPIQDEDDKDAEEVADEAEAEEEELRDIVHSVEISTAKFKGDNFEYQKSVLVDYIMTQFAEKKISVVTEGCKCKGFLTTKIVRN